MSTFCEYFVATDDASAAATLDWPGGPSDPPAGVPGYSALSLPDIEPTVILGALDEILTGRPIEDVLEDSTGHMVASDDGGWVWAITTTLQDALRSANDEGLRAAAAEWVHAEEFHGQFPVEDAEAAALALAAMMRAAPDEGARLYCWFRL